MIRKIIDIVPAEQQKAFKFRNYYRCPNDGTTWSDDWSCKCDDKCQVCGAAIEPFFSEDI